MSDRADALRYARELFDVTWRHGQAAAVAEELETLVQASREYQDAGAAAVPSAGAQGQQAGDHPRFTQGGHQQADGGAARGAGAVSRARSARRDASGFRERLNKKQGVVRARVTTAAPLPADKAEALAARLSEVTGRQVTLQTPVDPSIIGGVVTQSTAPSTTAA